MARILVVDDQESVLKTADALLKRLGHEVVLAKDGYIALEKVTLFTFDIVITDAAMPGISGWDLAKSLRLMDKTKQVPIIMMTAKSERRDVERAIQVHIDDYIVKPLDPDILMAKLKVQLIRRSNEVPKPELEIAEEAEVRMTAQLVAISEATIKMNCSWSAPVGGRLPVSCEFFNTLGIPPQNLRVLSCTAHTGASGYVIHAEFVDLKPEELTKIRVWLATTAKAS